MTHAVHRRIPAREEDYVLQLRSSKGINRDGAGEKLLQLLERMEPLQPVSYGNPGDGTTLRTSADDIKKNLNDGSNLHIVFKDTQSARKAVEIAKKMDTGLSVSLAGPLETIRSMAAEMGLRIDSVQIDLGTIGKKNFDAATEGILSLCGHMRVSENLIKEMREKVQSGEIDPETAARKIGKVCLCGCFNPHAAGKLLSQKKA
jgi:hypothetical protein